jgi:hypothetical protein
VESLVACGRLRFDFVLKRRGFSRFREFNDWQNGLSATSYSRRKPIKYQPLFSPGACGFTPACENPP